MAKTIEVKNAPNKIVLNKKLVKWFEAEQKEWGTETAIYNLLWSTAADIMHNIGVKHIKTSSNRDTK